MKISKAIISTMIIGTCLTACGTQQKNNLTWKNTRSMFYAKDIKEASSAKTIYVWSSRRSCIRYWLGWR